MLSAFELSACLSMSCVPQCLLRASCCAYQALVSHLHALVSHLSGPCVPPIRPLCPTYQALVSHPIRPLCPTYMPWPWLLRDDALCICLPVQAHMHGIPSICLKVILHAQQAFTNKAVCLCHCVVGGGMRPRRGHQRVACAWHVTWHVMWHVHGRR